MCETVISPLSVDKLGHEIQEIRERALANINSKLQNGLGFDNDLAGNKQLLGKLFEWFLLEPCTKQDLVLQLIKRILKSEPGKVLIQHIGSNAIRRELLKIKTYIDPSYHSDLEGILQILDNNREIFVPPLETDVPLSYRSGQSDSDYSTKVGSCRTISGLVQQDSSKHQTVPPDLTEKFFILSVLRWQSLIESDRNVLQSLENSLRKPPEPFSLIHSAEYFCKLLIRDFPAEVFLQRPKIVQIFIRLVTECVSVRVSNAILECLLQLTKALQVRIKQHEEIALHNFKQSVCSRSVSRTTSPRSVDDLESPQVSELLKSQQITFPHFCCSVYKTVFTFLTIGPDLREARRKSNQKGINIALELLKDILKLLTLVVGPNIWTDRNPEAELLSRQLSEALTGYGDLLEYYRLEALSNDSNTTLRAYQIALLSNAANFLLNLVPKSQCGLILPRTFKNALTNVLVDIALSKLHPEVYQTILDYVRSFTTGVQSESFFKYEETNKICASMKSAVRFLKGYKQLNASEGVKLAIEAIPSVEFHKNLQFVRRFFDFAAAKLPLYPYDDVLAEKFEFVTLKLLAHNVEKVQEESYKLCLHRVYTEIGPKLNISQIPGSEILFLLRANILIELACHGLTSHNPIVKKCTDDMLVYILKCKVLVCDEIWNKIIQALIPALPMLLCHVTRNSDLGRILMNFIDPDTAQTVLLPRIEVIKSNIHVLFNTDSSLREEAFSRLCWLLASQNDSKEMLPRLNNLHDKALPNVCQSQRPSIDLNKSRNLQHFYQASSLHHVLDLLKSSNVEPVIRRSALTQTSVMLEDPLLHHLFLEQNGLELLLDLMKSALIEDNYNVYPDLVVPIIASLKNLALYNRNARQELQSNDDLFRNVLRGLFMFFTEDRLKSDAVTLLFLMVFGDFVSGSPSKADLSIPSLVTLTAKVPFTCNVHWELSTYWDEGCFELLAKEKTCFDSIKIHWNALISGGFNELLSCPQLDYENMEIEDSLKLTDYDLYVLKAASPAYSVKKCLINIQNATSHEIVSNSLHKLTTYLQMCDSNVTAEAWETSLGRFLKSLPSSEEDVKLLHEILALLIRLVPFYNSSDNWIFHILKNPTSVILDLIAIDSSTDDDLKQLSCELLDLIKTCAIHEQHFLDLYSTSESRTSPWTNAIEIITNNLRDTDNSRFYNLAHLDALTSCLVHLTSILGWNVQKSKRIFHSIIKSLIELLVVFHSGKGVTLSTSVMGLCITRNVVLILNHLLVEMSSIKNWDECFLHLEDAEWIKSVAVLWKSTDVVLRAGSVQFFTGLTNSHKLTSILIRELKHEHGGIWHEMFDLFTDLDEANIVKENAAYLIGNLTRFRSGNHEKSLIPEPEIIRKERIDRVNIFQLLEEHKFYKYLSGVVESLYTHDTIELDSLSVSSLSSSDSSRNTNAIKTTPAFIKAIASLILNLLTLDCEGVCAKLQEANLVKLFFRCICLPVMPVDETKKLALYCEILEMDSAICALLTKLVQSNAICYGTVLHTKDCLNQLLALLNHKNYHTHMPALALIRNQLWSEIYRLLASLVTGSCHKDVGIHLSGSIEEVGCQYVMETTMEAAKSGGNLQESCLVFLASFLDLECLESSFLNRLLDANQSGGVLCGILLKLYALSNIQSGKETKKSLILSALSALLGASYEAKHVAMHQALPETIARQFKELHLKLSLECVDALRRPSDKKRIGALLRQVDELVGIATNFALGHAKVKETLTVEFGLCDLLHKLWAWCVVDKSHLINSLKLMATLTTDCPQVCHSMPLTSCTAGTGPRKIPAKISIVHALIGLVEKEMDQVSRTHDLTALQLAFIILANCCIASECRIIFCKSTLLCNLSKMHPGLTKRQKPWEIVELLWLEFLHMFTLHAEGQVSVAKNSEAFDILILLANGGKPANKTMALAVLRNICFHQSNRTRLLTSDGFLLLLESKLEHGSVEERRIAVVMMWALAANNQKAKILFKSARLDFKLELVAKEYQLKGTLNVPHSDIERIDYVLAMIRDGVKHR